MGVEMILLRVVDETLEGWSWMSLDEFLEQIDLTLWKRGQELVGVVLPPGRKQLH